MTEEKMKEMALENGFTYAEWMDVKDLQFDGSLRKYCEENLCGNYGRNYACPPDCGTTKQMEEKVRKYKRALVLETVQQIEDLMDAAEIKKTRARHNKMSWELIKKVQTNEKKGMAIMAGPCAVCANCSKIAGEPCRFPDQVASCLSAYCIIAEKMAEYCGLPYWCGANKVAFFSIYLCGDYSEAL